MTLAYVFWHWKQEPVSASDYEARQAAFQQALRDAPSPGFKRSMVLAVRGLPWAASGGAAYEDWYLVDGSVALDPLNDAAVTASRRPPHDHAAAAAAGGTAGLYRLRAGAPLKAPAQATWFSKPDGTSYAALDALLAPICAGGNAALWCRNMVLGPGPEFCLQATKPVTLPAPLQGSAVALRAVWAG